MIEIGAEDHLIKIAEKEIAMIPISKNNASGNGGLLDLSTILNFQGSSIQALAR